MPMHIERLTSDVSLHEGDLPLTPPQIEKLVALILARLEAREREKGLAKQATKLSKQAWSGFEAGD